ncbi:MAG: pyridoxal-phosphate dependent enzyme [Vicinamibacterales bacterium]|jgi:cysteine synthase/rhodanese-related sulfurtransferase|nr:pyridoxal-phosphate dependent enzyme [Vicinamibacterales bacterium]
MNDPALRVHDSILGLLSSADNPTPLVRLNRVVPFRDTQVYAKLEWYNPFGAVKDRVAANLVADGEERRTVQPDQKLVEPTSGNTGMALAMIANAKGYTLTTPLSIEIPLEKRTMLRLFGAEVIELEDNLCPAPGAPEGAIATAMEMAERSEFHMLNQYVNEANPDAHYKTTGPEIWRQTEGTVTHFVAGLGTCGTVTGTGRFLKEQRSAVQVLGVHPSEGHDIPGVRSLQQLQQTQLFRPAEYDGLAEVQNQAAFELCLRLNREESITAGPSSAMALAGAFELVPDEPGNVVVVTFPDSAFKYASSVVKYLPGLEASTAKPAAPSNALLDTMVENVRGNADLTIDIDAAHEQWQADRPFVLDVRPSDEYREAHIPGAINRPLEVLGEHHEGLPDDLDTPILSVCQRGNTSLSGVLFLKSLGYRNVRSINGGTIAWREKGFATDAE